MAPHSVSVYLQIPAWDLSASLCPGQFRPDHGPPQMHPSTNWLISRISTKFHPGSLRIALSYRPLRNPAQDIMSPTAPPPQVHGGASESGGRRDAGGAAGGGEPPGHGGRPFRHGGPPRLCAQSTRRVASPPVTRLPRLEPGHTAALSNSASSGVLRVATMRCARI